MENQDISGKEAGFDLSALDTAKAANAGFNVDLYHPANNADLGIKIRVLGKDSDEFRRVSNAQNKRRMDRMQRGGFRNTTPSPEELEQNGIELLAACTLGWTGVIVDGQPLAFSRDNVKMLYGRFPWIKEQVDAAIGDRANFIQN